MMHLQMNIPESQFKHFLGHYTMERDKVLLQIRELEEYVTSLERTIVNIQAAIEKSGKPMSIPFGEFPGSTDGYNPEWPLSKKILFVIKRAGKPMGAGEILKSLEVFNQSERINRNSFNPTLSKMVKENQLLKVKSDGPYPRYKVFSKN